MIEKRMDMGMNVSAYHQKATIETHIMKFKIKSGHLFKESG